MATFTFGGQTYQVPDGCVPRNVTVTVPAGSVPLSTVSHPILGLQHVQQRPRPGSDAALAGEMMTWMHGMAVIATKRNG